MPPITEELRVVEELLLLVLDTDSGDIHHSLPMHTRAVAFAGAVLMDLALEDRIDTDLEHLVVSDPTPLGSDLHDPILADIAGGGEQELRDTAFWIADLAGRSDELREKALARLIERGIVEADTGPEVVLSADVSRLRRYTTTNGQVTDDVQLRIMRALFSDDIPDPRDIVIISLASACGVFETILSRDELAQVRERIDLICRLDLIGREVVAAIRQLEPPPAPAPPPARSAAEIPLASGLPLLGNAVDMARDLRGFLLREYRQHGPVFRVRALRRSWIALVGPEANIVATQISHTHLRSWEPYREFSAAVDAHRVLLTMDGAEHLRMRKLLIKGYSPRVLESHLDSTHDLTRRLIEEWPQGQPMSIQHAMQRIITEQIGMFCSNLRPGEYFDDLAYFLGMTIELYMTKRMPAVMGRLPKYRRAKARVKEFYEHIMEAHRPELREGQPRDFVDELLEANREDPQFLPETDLFANVLAPYLVGMDTSASACAFMLYSLLRHPDLLERVRAEVDEMYEQGPPTPAGLRNLDVTHRVALETLRMYPIVPALTRTVSNSFEFEGYRIPAGSDVMLGTTVGHHLPEYFPEPDRFDIERYADDRREHRQPGAFAPFGVGRHRCIGNSLSEMQIAFTLAAVVRLADLELERPERPLKIKHSPAAHPDESVRVRLVGLRE